MSSSAGTPQNSVCPFLGIIDETGKPAPYVEYPSFENRCFVTADPEAVMLTDQATFCLSSGYRHCPRLAAAQGKAAPALVAHPLRQPATAREPGTRLLLVQTRCNATSKRWRPNSRPPM